MFRNDKQIDMTIFEQRMRHMADHMLEAVGADLAAHPEVQAQFRGREITVQMALWVATELSVLETAPFDIFAAFAGIVKTGLKNLMPDGMPDEVVIAMLVAFLTEDGPATTEKVSSTEVPYEIVGHG